jgi:hypothetical protein
VPAARSAVQFTRSLSRDWPDWINGDLWPRINPAVTTAMMPEPWNSPTTISSAGTYAAKGTKIEIAVSNTGWVIRRRIGITARATSSPTTPPLTAIRKPPVTSAAETAPPIAAMATRRQVIAVASLTSDSPSKMVTSWRGRPTRRAIEVAATASGGATTAPRANATAKSTGRIHQVIRPTPRAVTTTSSTDSEMIERLLARKSITDVRIAVA